MPPLHLLLKLLLERPHLLADHAGGYAMLLAEEGSSAASALRQQLLRWALTAIAWTLAAIWAGVALMLWAALPEIRPEHAWILVATPAVAVMAASLVWLSSRRHQRFKPFAELRQQAKADMALWRELAETP